VRGRHAAIGEPAGPDDLSLEGRLASVTDDNILREPDAYIWGGSGIQGEDGKYYLFYARSPNDMHGRASGDSHFADMSGWLKYADIAAAVSDQPAGPFKPLGTVLKGTGNPADWNCFTAILPQVRRYGSKVCLYFTSTNPESDKAPADRRGESAAEIADDNNRWLRYLAGQRIGVAVADSVADLAADRLQGHPQMLVGPDGKNTFNRTVTPAVTQGSDGRYFMMFTSTSSPDGRGPSTLRIATAPSPIGPFTPAGVVFRDANYAADDPCLWYDLQRRRYYAIVKNSSNSGVLGPQAGALALITSEDGLTGWRAANHKLVSLRQYQTSDGKFHPLSFLERPSLLLDGQNRPLCLFAVASEGPPPPASSFNIQFPILPPEGASTQSAEKH